MRNILKMFAAMPIVLATGFCASNVTAQSLCADTGVGVGIVDTTAPHLAKNNQNLIAAASAFCENSGSELDTGALAVLQGKPSVPSNSAGAAP